MDLGEKLRLQHIQNVSTDRELGENITHKKKFDYFIQVPKKNRTDFYENKF